MTHLNDLVRGGYDPLQDHDPEQQIHGRVVRYACRVERTIRDARRAGKRVIEGHNRDDAEGEEISEAPDKTAGDVFGGLIALQEPGLRPCPMWSFALPVVTTEAIRDLREDDPLSVGTKVRSDPDGGGTQTADVADKRVKVRPIQDADYSSDDRFREIDTAVYEGAGGLPVGYPGIVLAAIQEQKQVELFLPAGAGPLIAVDHAGDPELATLVSDLDTEDKIDSRRQARLHTLARVVRLGESCGPLAKNNALAWQLKHAGQDGFAGGGLVIDSGTAFPAPEPEPAAEALPQPIPTSGAPGPEEVQAQYGAVTDLRTAKTPTPQEGQVGGVRFLTDPTDPQDLLDGTVTRERGRPGGPGTQARPLPNAPPVAASALIVAAASSKLGGPLDVGSLEDRHRLGMTLDGDPVNSLHLSTAAPWIGLSEDHDGPLDFEGAPYQEPPDWPFTAKVHLRWDAGAMHEWVCGPKPPS